MRELDKPPTKALERRPSQESIDDAAFLKKIQKKEGEVRGKTSITGGGEVEKRTTSAGIFLTTVPQDQ